MRGIKYDMDVKATIAAGDAMPTKDLSSKRVKVGSAAFTATVDLEGTINGDDWNTIQAGITANQIIEVAPWWFQMRTKTTGAGTAPRVTLGGFDENTV